MRPHPRIRKTIKWGGAAVTVLLVGVWIGSGWWNCTIVRLSEVTAWAGHGVLEIQYWDSFSRAMGSDESVLFSRPAILRRESFEMQYWFSSQSQLPQYCHIQIPIWLAVVASIGAWAVSWRLDTLARHRAKLNLCPHCNYDRTGLTGGAGAVCPECGAKPDLGP
jgi:hypothetical protein